MGTLTKFHQLHQEAKTPKLTNLATRRLDLGISRRHAWLSWKSQRGLGVVGVIIKWALCCFAIIDEKSWAFIVKNHNFIRYTGGTLIEFFQMDPKHVLSKRLPPTEIALPCALNFLEGVSFLSLLSLAHKITKRRPPSTRQLSPKRVSQSHALRTYTAVAG